jgi:serine/threonine protein kinase
MNSCPICEATYPNTYAVCPQDGTPLVDVTAWSPGTLVRGKYRIISKVGQGGMGAVYKALHVAFDESRALKVISRELMTDELFVKRFKHEAVITRKLQHPNAVRVDDIDEAEDGRPFIVMEYIEGQSLKKLIQEHGALPVPRVCSIVKQVAAALEAAHGLGLVHRDIKPDNIVLIEAPEGEQAKVLDFGIAKLKEGRKGDTAGMTLTGTGVVIGTPQYMSPEQAMGKRGDQLDGRSDLYSLGVVMYQMLTGDLPFKADTTMEMLLAHLQKPPTPFHVLRPELQIGEAVASLVMKTLEKDRELRPATARAFIQEIERVESAREQGTGTPTAPTHAVETTPPQAPAVAPPPPAPVARPAPSPQPYPVPSPPRPEAGSRWGIWASIAILAVGLGGGAWYFATRQTADTSVPPGTISQPISEPANTEPNGGEEPSVSQPEASAPEGPTQVVKQPETTPPKPPSSGASSPTRRETSTRQPRVTEATRPRVKQPTASEPATNPLAARPTTRRPTATPVRESPPSKPAVESKEVTGAFTLGNFYLDHGDYDKAIAEFRKGLRLDPSNVRLRQSLRRAQRAKAAEDRILQ